MSEWAVGRFWKVTSARKVDGGFTVFLDERSIKTPSKSPLVVPTIELAEMLAVEWDAQSEKIDPKTMPATRMANAAIDKVSAQHGEVADLIAAYGDADLLCYRADSPVELIERQNIAWNPMLDWAADNFDAQLLPRQGVIHQGQDAAAIARLTARVHQLSNFELAAFHDLVSLTGSLVLGFATTFQTHPDEELWDLSRIDENWQEEQWGQDDEASALADQKREAFLHAAIVFRLSQIKL